MGAGLGKRREGEEAAGRSRSISGNGEERPPPRMKEEEEEEEEMWRHSRRLRDGEESSLRAMAAAAIGGNPM